MRTFLFSLIFIGANFSVFAQEYLDKIAEAACSCIEKKDFKKDKNATEMQMEMGFCMIEASDPYKKQLLRDFKVDLTRIDYTTGQELGRVIGVKMAGKCPEIVVALAKKMDPENEYFKDPPTNNYAEGTITKVETETFVVLHIKNEDSGKTTKYYWMEYVDSELDLVEEAGKFPGKAIEFTYEEKEFFDPKINEYRNYFILKQIRLADE